ncbi:hypothetical protein L0337_20030 [candidate division KSB1 bacterium]|nr:hypothetical protein [candidate division KSB1 bacterium]
MKNLLSACILLLLSITENGVSQGLTLDNEKAEIYLETGYFTPAKKSFRKNYDQALFISKINIPLSAGIGFRYFMTENACLHLSVKRINSILESNEDVTLAVMPVAVGVQYYLLRNFFGSKNSGLYFGSDIGFYWARFSADLIQTSEFDPTPIGLIKEARNYYGIGVAVRAGLDHMLSHSLLLGLSLSYDSNHLGRIEEGGVGNLGGLLVTGKFALRF